MAESDLRRLAHEFHAAVDTSYAEGAKRGYHAARFKQMLEEVGGAETANRLLADTREQSGLFKLWELGVLSDSLEAIVLQERFGLPFTEKELAEARRRLEELATTCRDWHT